jgi:hypothetical protein
VSFRRNGDKALAWKRWVGQHRDELTAGGVPDAVFSDELRWWRFLEEGGLDTDTGWCVEMLSPQQAETLRGLITRESQRPDLACCLRCLSEVIQGKRPSSQV